MINASAIMRLRSRRVACTVALALCAVAWPGRPCAQAARPSTFAALVARLSEPGGYFGGDNLISNEQSYLRVLPALEQAKVTGGAYLGVGPDQNFSYIAQIRPSVAFIIDIRRDNLLLHLLFKALFAAAPTRVEYLSLLTGRAPPDHPETWNSASIDTLVSYIDRMPAMPAPALMSLRTRLEAGMTSDGVPLSASDFLTIAAFHRGFIDAGLSLVFQAHGQPVRDYYPSLRTLLRETDGTGRQRSFLATEPGFQFVRSLEGRDLVVPVVGDVSGPRAMQAIAAEMTARSEPLSALYISNVEYYLFADGRFAAFAENLKRLPRNDRSTMIRSVFPGGYRGPLRQAVAGSYSTSLVQPLGQMLGDLSAGRYRSYADLVVASAR
jgi:hypothetical protein